MFTNFGKKIFSLFFYCWNHYLLEQITAQFSECILNVGEKRKKNLKTFLSHFGKNFWQSNDRQKSWRTFISFLFWKKILNYKSLLFNQFFHKFWTFSIIRLKFFLGVAFFNEDPIDKRYERVMRSFFFFLFPNETTSSN